MGKALLVVILVLVIIFSFKRPYVGVCAYYLMSILAPQFIWPWAFEGIPVFQILAGLVLLIFVFSILDKKIDLSIYQHKQNILLLLLFLLVHLSDWLSPFNSFTSATTAALVLDTFNTIFLLYFVSLPFIATEKGLKWLFGTFILILLYYVYWSNHTYFSYNVLQFNQGRLMGPVLGPYKDENKFAALFVAGAPFLLFGVFYLRTNLQKIICISLLLLTWHSIFLTASRGALLATAISTLFAATLIGSKKLGLALVIGFTLVVIDQGAQSFTRSSDTIAAAKELEGKSIDPRISSWTAGFGFMAEHPLLGVGVQRFQEATRRYYPEKHPYVAHNTFISIAAESGLLAGFIFLYLYWMNLKKAIKFTQKGKADYKYCFDTYLRKATITSLTGIYSVSLFLDMLIYELVYLLLLLLVSRELIFNKKA